MSAVSQMAACSTEKPRRERKNPDQAAAIRHLCFPESRSSKDENENEFTGVYDIDSMAGVTGVNNEQANGGC